VFLYQHHIIVISVQNELYQFELNYQYSIKSQIVFSDKLKIISTPGDVLLF